ncbi:MAG TPA: V-type ATPase 116kDa subunit family protein, partial [Thermoplasmata archaeon]|nr:V-type ATPase 116kDa subunit family protein [Thermoplasmata archaeon]
MTFLKPVAMAKVGILGLKSDRPAILAALHDLGLVQFEAVRKEAMAELGAETGGEPQRQVADQLLRFRTLKNSLPPVASAPREVGTLDQLLASTASVHIDGEVLELKREEDRLLTERKQLVDVQELLSRHRYWTVPLEQLRSRHLLAFFGESTADGFPLLQREIEAIAEAAFTSAPEGKQVRFVVAVPTANADAVGRLAQQAGVKLAPVPALDGRIDEELPKLAARLQALDQRLSAVKASLADVARRFYAPVAAIEEGLTIENRKFELFGRMGGGRESFTVEGWVPQRSLPLLEHALAGVAADRVLLYPIPTTEEPPTLIENPPGVRRFEFFIRFYALPKATEFDPTWIFALAFPIFFGFMLGDWGYGLVILLFSVWMIAGFPGGGKLPNAVKSFPKLIMSPSSMQTLAWTLLPGCVAAIALGFYYNELFGFQLPWYMAPADPIHNVGKLLVIAGYIGLTMVCVGFGLGALRAYYTHHPKLAVMRIGGIVLAVGIAFAGLTVIRSGGINFHNSTLVALLLVVLVGFALMFAGEGLNSLMGLIEVVSHILS